MNSEGGMQWRMDDLPVYLAIVEQKGISAAAVQLNLSKSMVSKALGRLEEALGVRLIERNSRNVRVTSEGEAFYRQGVLIMEQVSEASALMAGLTNHPAGRLVVAMPMAFAREVVARHLPAFRGRYPQIDLELMVSSHPVDIIRDQIDIAVVIGAIADTELVAKPLYRSRLLWVSSPEYAAAHRLDGDADQLREHLQICERRYAVSRFPVRDGEHRASLDLSRGVMQVNDPIAVREAVLHGGGVSMLPDQYCKREIERGELVEVYRHIGFEESAAVLSAVYPGRRLISNKTRAFLDFLEAVCRGL